MANGSVSRWGLVTIRGSGLGPVMWDVLTSVPDWDRFGGGSWPSRASGVDAFHRDQDKPKTGSS